MSLWFCAAFILVGCAPRPHDVRPLPTPQALDQPSQQEEAQSQLELELTRMMQESGTPSRRSSLEHVRAAARLLRQKSFAKAQEHLDRGQTLDPRNPMVYFYRGRLQTLRGRTAQGMIDFQRAAELFEEEDLTSWADLAKAHVRHYQDRMRGIK